MMMGPSHLIAIICTLGITSALVDLPDPRIVIVGPTGAGKSSLANALLGCDPRGDECMFNMCGGLESCTKNTTFGTGLWLGTGKNYTIVDTPGFGDSAGEDNELIEEMMEVLDGSLGYANTILLLFDGQTARFSTGLHNMLRQMSSLFGDAWWDYMIIGVSKWKYSQETIDARQEDCDYYGDPSENCKNEAWFMREMNSQLQEKFHLEKNFTFAFIDSYSQSGPQLNDEVQQEHYQAEAKILWDSATTKNSTFQFMTIDDVLEENAVLKEEIKMLHDVFEKNITTLFALVHDNLEIISSNKESIDINVEAIDVIANEMDDHQTAIDSNKEGITTNVVAIDGIANEMDDQQSAIDSNKEGITTNVNALEVIASEMDDQQSAIDSNKDGITTNKDGITTNKDGIATNENAIDGISNEMDDIKTVPLGTIIAWISKPTSDGEAVDIPDGFVRCDGTTIPHPSIWHGQLTPNLNLERRFLRGGADKDMLNMEEDTLQDHLHSFHDPGHTHSITDPGHTHGYDDKYPDSQESMVGPESASYVHIWYQNSHSRTTSSKSTGITVDSKSTGITVGAVTSSSRRGSETKPRNMNVIYIIRVW